MVVNVILVFTCPPFFPSETKIIDDSNLPSSPKNSNKFNN